MKGSSDMRLSSEEESTLAREILALLPSEAYFSLIYHLRGDDEGSLVSNMPPPVLRKAMEAFIQAWPPPPSKKNLRKRMDDPISDRAWVIAVARSIEQDFSAERLFLRSGNGRKWWDASGWITEANARAVQDELDAAEA